MRWNNVILVIALCCSTGCGDHKVPNLTIEETFQIMDAISNHPIAEKYPNSELGGKYDKGDHWLIEIRKRRTKKPSTWLAIDKTTKVVKVVD